MNKIRKYRSPVILFLYDSYFASKSSVPASGSSVKFSPTRDIWGVRAPGGMTSSCRADCVAFLSYLVKPNLRSIKMNGMKKHDDRIKITMTKYPQPGYWVGTTSACQWNGDWVRKHFFKNTIHHDLQCAVKSNQSLQDQFYIVTNIS